MGAQVLTADAERRFWAKVHKGPDCWTWVGATADNGYGNFWTGERQDKAHRIAFNLKRGEIPDGYDIDHLCRNRGCVNPDHLEVATRQVNLLRGFSPSAIHARKTHCPRGHSYDLFNTYRRPNGSRVCRECARIGEQKRVRKRKAIWPKKQ